MTHESQHTGEISHKIIEIAREFLYKYESNKCVDCVTNVIIMASTNSKLKKVFKNYAGSDDRLTPQGFRKIVKDSALPLNSAEIDLKFIQICGIYYFFENVYRQWSLSLILNSGTKQWY